MGGHSSRTGIAPGLKQPTRTTGPKPPCPKEARRPYSVLLPVGFTVPPSVTGGAVRSYRTLSLSHGRNRCDLLSVALSLGSPPPAINWHRFFVEPGLSSPPARSWGRGRPTLWRVTI